MFPVFAKVREKARTASCQSNLKQLGIAISMYVTDHDSVFPKRENVDDWNRRGGWMVAVYPYVKNAQLYLCPSDEDPYAPAGLTGAPVTRISYMSSSFAVSNPPKGEPEFESPSELMLLSEGNTGGEIRQGDINGTGAPGTVNERIELNHFEGFNILYVDGHVKWSSYQSAIANRATLIP
jgi:prepilin-type processing-associated H-X9-DG protein